MTLTAGLARPSLALGHGPFSVAYPEVFLGSGAGKALMLRYRLNRKAVAVFLVVELILWLLFGAVLGVLVQGLELGLLSPASGPRHCVSCGHRCMVV